MKNILYVLAILCPVLLIGQNDLNELDENMESKVVRNWEGTLSLGFGAYEGDLHSFSDEDLNAFTDLGFSFGIGIKKYFNESFNLALNYTNLAISADEKNFADEGHRQRGYSFENNLNEISVMAEYYPFGNKEWKIQPYITGGLGLAFGSADVTFGSDMDIPNNPDVQKDINDAKNASFTLPLGLGVKMQLTDRISLAAQVNHRSFSNDYLDGVSEAGNPDIGDYFGDGVLKLGYSF